MPQGFLNSFIFTPPVVVPAAYSQYSVVRKVVPAYAGNALQVIRTSDSTTLDIGFTGGDLVDSAAIAAFCSGTTGFVSVFYDQSGNARNMTPPGATQRPRIYDGAAVTTRNGFNVMQFDGSNDLLQTALDAGFTGETSWCLVFSSDTLQTGTYPASGRKTTDFMIFESQAATVNYRLFMTMALASTNFDPIDQLQIGSMTFADTSTIQRNGDAVNSSAPGQVMTEALGVALGGHPGGFGFSNCEISEFQVWTPALNTAQKGAVRDGVNAFYALY